MRSMLKTRVVATAIAALAAAALPAQQPQPEPMPAAAEKPKPAEDGKKAQPKPGPERQDGTSCVTPRFSFKWPDHRSPVLVATADKEASFLVWVAQQPNANELTRGWLRNKEDRDKLAPSCFPSCDEEDQALCYKEDCEEEDAPCFTEEVLRKHRVYDPAGWPGYFVKAKPNPDHESEASVNLVCFPHLFITPHVLIHYEMVAEDGSELAEDSAVPAACREGVSPALPVFDKHLIRFDVGTVFALSDSSEYTNSAELAITSTSRWTRKWTGVVDIRFSELGDLEESDDGTNGQDGQNGGDGNGEGGAETAGETGNGNDEGDSMEVFSPFLKGGSFLRANAYLAWSPKDWKPEVGGNRIGRSMTMIFGGGFSTVPGETADFTDAKLRYFAGARFQIIGYNRGRPGTGLEDSFGFFQAGYARDRLWKYTETVETEVDGETVTETRERDEQDRFFMEAEIEIPRLGTKSLRLVLRGFADLPTSGSGPADVRVSALVGVKPTQLAGIFGQ